MLLGVVLMRRSARILVLPALVSGLTVLLLVLPGSSAYAYGPPGAKVSCTTVSGIGEIDIPLAIGGCSKTQASGGSGTISFINGFDDTVTVTWSGGLGTTTFQPSVHGLVAKRDKCARSDPNEAEFVLHGADLTSSPAGGSPGVKGTVSARICVNNTTQVESLLPGSHFKI